MKIPKNKNIALDSKQHQNDKRRFKRVKVRQDINSNMLIDRRVIPVYIIDLSNGGAKLRSNAAFKPGTSIQLMVFHENTVNGKIKWIKKLSQGKDDCYLGIEFEKTLEKSTCLKYIENRRFERKKSQNRFYIDIWPQEGENNLREVVQVADISEGGIRIVTPNPLTPDTLLNLKLSKNNILTGRVRWCSSICKESSGEFFIGIEFIRGDIDKEIEQLRENIAKKPYQIDCYDRLGIALRKKKRYEEALASYKRAIKIDKDNELLYLNMARVYIEMKNSGQAIRVLEKTLKLNPKFFDAKLLLKKITRES